MLRLLSIGGKPDFVSFIRDYFSTYLLLIEFVADANFD